VVVGLVATSSSLKKISIPLLVQSEAQASRPGSLTEPRLICQEFMTPYAN
jgi:hypothetical protein